jgi:hypothetical protein
MTGNLVSWAAVFLLLLTSTSMLVFYNDKQRALFIFAAQYLAAFTLILRHWPLGMAAVKLVSGWMALTILGATFRDLPGQPQTKPYSMGIQIFASAIILALSITAAPLIEFAIPGLGEPVISGSLLLIGIGLLHLSFTSEIDRILFALLTVMTGFEILYAAVEGSVLVAGLLSIITLGIAITGAYLLTILHPVEDEPEDILL